jgi:hypothetical protein
VGNNDVCGQSCYAEPGHKVSIAIRIDFNANDSLPEQSTDLGCAEHFGLHASAGTAPGRMEMDDEGHLFCFCLSFCGFEISLPAFSCPQTA